MIVRISDYGERDEKKFIEYDVEGLSSHQVDFLCENLTEKTVIDGEILRITMFFSDELYPFQSDAAKVRPDDFIAREEIEMNVFLSSFLEDM